MSEQPAEVSPAQRVLHRRITLIFALLGIVVALLGVSVFAANLCVGAISAMLVPVVGAVALVTRPVPAEVPTADASLVRFARHVGVPLRCCAALCLLAGCAASLRHLGVARQVSKSAISASNVRGLLHGMRAYHQECGAYPFALANLVESGQAWPNQLLVHWDWTGDEARVEREGYSSYVYQCGVGPWREDPGIVLLYERLAWSHGRATWCCPPGYQVGFADGRVEWLDVSELTEVLARDARRRSELGWPIGPAPSVPPTSQPRVGRPDDGRDSPR
jgi:hypothetical protein